MLGLGFNSPPLSKQEVDASVQAAISTKIKEDEDKYKDLSLKESEIKKQWWEYLPMMRDILAFIDSVPVRSFLVLVPCTIDSIFLIGLREPTTWSARLWMARQNLEEISSAQNIKVRRFSLLPLYSFDVKHVRITNTILFDLIQRLKNTHKSQHFPNLKDFMNNKHEWWSHYFDLEKVTTRRRSFGESIVTDGYGVSVTVTTPKPSQSGGGKRNKVPVQIEGKRVISVDPGARDLVTCLSYRKEDTEATAPEDQTSDDENISAKEKKRRRMKNLQVTWRYSHAEYKRKLGASKASRRRQFWIRRARLETALNELPSAKTCNPVELLDHVRELQRILSQVLGLNGRRRVRELRFKQFTKKQKVILSLTKAKLSSTLSNLMTKHSVPQTGDGRHLQEDCAR